MRRVCLLSVLLLAALGCVLARRHHEKTRFDRSINYKSPKYESFQEKINKKQRIISDPITQYTAYKDAAHSICYLEKMRNNRIDDANRWRDVIRGSKKIHHASNTLTKIEAWHLAGSHVVNFCRGMVFVHLQKESLERIDDPYQNLLPEDIGVIRKQLVDAPRMRREALPYRGRFRGQTQSQYLNVGRDGQKEGKAEAEATQQSSRAVVSGSSGMGQAQSMSSGTEGCEGCSGYAPSIPASIMASLGSQQGAPTGVKKTLHKSVV